MSELQDKVTAAETEIAELRNKVDDLEYDYDKSDQRARKLDKRLADCLQKLRSFEEDPVVHEGGRTISGVSKNKVNFIFPLSNLYHSLKFLFMLVCIPILKVIYLLV